MVKTLREKYLAYQKKIAHINHIQWLLSRDQEAMMPVGAGEGRAEQIGYMAGLLHEATIDVGYGDLLATLLEKKDALEPRQVRSVQLAQKEREKSICLDASFVEHFEVVKSLAQQVRSEARRTNDFKLFAPHLAEVINCTKQYTQQIVPWTDCYDVLLDEFEEGSTQARYNSILLPLQQPLTDLMHTATVIGMETLYEKAKSWLTTEETKQLLRELVTTIWFDLQTGMLGEVHHPFMTTLWGADYRINTRYDHPIDAITWMIHELGHGLYEQRNNQKFVLTNLHWGVTLGMHESQSRTLENMFWRSKPMCFYLDMLCKKYGKQYTGSVELWYTIINAVRPSFIRIEADEVSYGLHILLRYELEKQLMSWSLGVQDIPDAWRTYMQQYLGVVPQTDTEGCLQDVHRSCGLIGYFPTYLLGNIYGGQLFASFEQQHPAREQEVTQGDFRSYFSRYKEQVWQWWRSIPSWELVTHVTGKPLDSSYFMRYLQQKFA